MPDDASPSPPKPPVPKWRWAIWWTVLGAAVVVFYVLLTPVWLGLRAAAWVAEWRSRRRRAAPSD
jgi:hypothetical protein